MQLQEDKSAILETFIHTHIRFFCCCCCLALTFNAYLLFASFSSNLHISKKSASSSNHPLLEASSSAMAFSRSGFSSRTFKSACNSAHDYKLARTCTYYYHYHYHYYATTTTTILLIIILILPPHYATTITTKSKNSTITTTES